MTVTIRESIAIPRPAAFVADAVTAAERAFPLFSSLGQFTYVDHAEDGTELWDMVVDIGTVRLAERIEVRSDATTLAWESIRGPQHSMTISVDDHDEAALITMTMTLELGGVILGRLAEFVARGIASRHMIAALERLRHRLTFDEE